MILIFIKRVLTFFIGLFAGTFISFQLFQECWSDSRLYNFIGTFSLAVAIVFLILSLFLDFKVNKINKAQDT